jgi:carboxyl-terminal processing protease
MKKQSILVYLLLVTYLLCAQSKNNSQKNTSNLQNLSWSVAVDSLNSLLKERYAFTQWKAINWDEKLMELQPKVTVAEQNNDSVGFLKALSEYLFSVPDGHITIKGMPDYYKHSIAGGTYGFNMIPVDDGSVLVAAIVEESMAYQTGIRTGDKITKWNGVPIEQINNQAQYNFYANYATEQGRLFSNYLMLGRDSVGTVSNITYSGPDDIEHQVTLTAVDDNMQLLLAGFINTVTYYNTDSIVTYRMLENNIGYLRIQAEMSEAETIEGILTYPDFIKMENAVKYFNENQVNKMIMDIRLNQGGNDLQAAVSMGLFFNYKSFYEHMTSNYATNYAITYTLYTEPLSTLFDGEIAVLIDPNCISTGEGFAMMFDRLENAHIVSHWGTNGSFGMVDWDPVEMPLGIAVGFPQGRSLNENYVIQIDSDSLLVGGIYPDVKVPLDRDAVIKQWQNGIDVQLEYAKGYLLNIEDNYQHSMIMTYPNPCNDHIYFNFKTKPSNNGLLSIYDLTGKMIIQNYIEANPGILEVNVSSLQKGAYIYSYTSNSDRFSGKLIVN